MPTPAHDRVGRRPALAWGLAAVVVLCVGAVGQAADGADGPPSASGAPAVRAAGGDEAAARAELFELRTLLDTWVAHIAWPHVGGRADNQTLVDVLDGDPTPAISARLALFPGRFGLDPHECDGWSELSSAAGSIHGRLLAALRAQGPAMPHFSDVWLAPQWVAARALLLEVSGRGDAARTLLLGDAERTWRGCCPYDLSEDLYWLTRARAEYLDRAGEAAAALRWYHEAFFWCEADEFAEDFGRPRVASDLALARYAALLAEAGELDAAAHVVRTLGPPDDEPLWLPEEASLIGIEELFAVERAPDDDLQGLSVVRSLLGDQLSSAADPAVSIFSVPLHDGSDAGSFGAGMAHLVGDADDLASWRVLAVRLPRFPERQHERRWMPDCGTDLIVVDPTDPRVLPLVERCLVRQEACWWAPALLVYAALGHPAHDRLETCLRQAVLARVSLYRPSSPGGCGLADCSPAALGCSRRCR